MMHNDAAPFSSAVLRTEALDVAQFPAVLPTKAVDAAPFPAVLPTKAIDAAPFPAWGLKAELQNDTSRKETNGTKLTATSR